jgi:hypothetical protein
VAIFDKKWSKLAEILRKRIKSSLNKLAVLTKKNKKKIASENIALPPTRRQKPTHKSQTAAGFGSASVLRNQKNKATSKSIK